MLSRGGRDVFRIARLQGRKRLHGMEPLKFLLSCTEIGHPYLQLFQNLPLDLGVCLEDTLNKVLLGHIQDLTTLTVYNKGINASG